MTGGYECFLGAGRGCFGLFYYVFYSRVDKILAKPPKRDTVFALNGDTSAKFQQFHRCLIIETADVLSRCLNPPLHILSSLAL